MSDGRGDTYHLDASEVENQLKCGHASRRVLLVKNVQIAELVEVSERRVFSQEDVLFDQLEQPFGPVGPHRRRDLLRVFIDERLRNTGDAGCCGVSRARVEV